MPEDRGWGQTGGMAGAVLELVLHVPIAGKIVVPVLI